MKASLKDIVDALEFLTDEHFHFLDRQTGKVEMVSREVLGIVEESGTVEDALEWQDHEFEVAEAIFADWDRFEKLPTKRDVNDWEIMREFAESVEPERFSDELQNAIHGGGAFRYFKDTLWRYRREQEWFAYRTAALRDIAIEWCEQHGIEYTG
jgi:transketolase